MARLPFVITGASGRVGRLLRLAWETVPPAGLDLIWLARADWNIGHTVPPKLPPGAVILHLAGQTRRALSENADIASLIAAQARVWRVSRLFIASSASVYSCTQRDISEQHHTGPVTAYGASKLRAEAQALAGGPRNTTLLRIGNIAGADTILGKFPSTTPLVLDQVPGHSRGPVRSYIGPQALAAVVARLAQLWPSLPPVLNVALPKAVAMADLLDAAGVPWHFGPLNPRAIPKVGLDVSRLAALTMLPAASASSIVADLRALVPGGAG